MLFIGCMGFCGYFIIDLNGFVDEVILLSFSGGGVSIEDIFFFNENVDG